MDVDFSPDRTTYKADDREAERRKVCRSVDVSLCRVATDVLRSETQEEAEPAKQLAQRPKLQQQFVDLKRGLAAVTDKEWTNIPEVSNFVRGDTSTHGMPSSMWTVSNYPFKHVGGDCAP